MAVNLSPFGPKPQFELSSGLPAVGYKLFFYVAGSVNTKQNTYTDSTGSVANTNPIILDSLGQPATQIWFTAGQSYKVVYAPSTDTDPPTSPIWTVDNLVGINDTGTSLDQWIASGVTPTFVSATQFTVPGDQTSAFAVGRRVKCTVTAGTVYGRITASVFAALTTVTVSIDLGSLDSGLSAVALGLLTPEQGSIPWVKLSTGALGTNTWTFDGRVAFNSSINEAYTTLAAAATINIGATAANSIDITGNSVSISAGDAVQAGTRRLLRFTGTGNTLVHSATFQLPTSANISVNQFDQALFLSYGGGTWVCAGYFRISGAPLTGFTSAATQAEQEAGTSTTAFVSPGRQQFHLSAIKGWVKGDFALGNYNSYNVSSVADPGTGLADVNWNVDFSSANYGITTDCESASNLYSLVDGTTTPTAGTTRVAVRNTGTGTLTDATRYYCAAWGDQA